jgi:hypothetical protein
MLECGGAVASFFHLLIQTNEQMKKDFLPTQCLAVFSNESSVRCRRSARDRGHDDEMPFEINGVEDAIVAGSPAPPRVF